MYSFNHFSNQIKYSVEKFEGLYGVRVMYEKVLQAYVRGDNVMKVMGKWWEEVDSLVKCAFKAVEQMKVFCLVYAEKEASIGPVT